MAAQETENLRNLRQETEGLEQELADADAHATETGKTKTEHKGIVENQPQIVAELQKIFEALTAALAKLAIHNPLLTKEASDKLIEGLQEARREDQVLFLSQFEPILADLQAFIAKYTAELNAAKIHREKELEFLAIAKQVLNQYL